MIKCVLSGSLLVEGSSLDLGLAWSDRFSNFVDRTGEAERKGRSNVATRLRLAKNLGHGRKPGVERLENRELLTLVSYWTADNTAVDAVGDNDGTLVSGADYAAGQINQAFHFDGIDDRVQVADSPSLQLTESLTIEAWVRTDSIPVVLGNILSRDDDRRRPYGLYMQSRGEAIMFFEIQSLTESAHLTAVMPVGQFVHVVGTLEDATGVMRLYFNGVLMAQITTTVRPFGQLDPNSNPGIGIGNSGGYPNSSNNFPFHGLIDELKVYDHALTAEDVLANFSASKGSMQPAISITDVTTIEGDPSVRYLGNLVSRVEGGLFDPLFMTYSLDGDALYVSTY